MQVFDKRSTLLLLILSLPLLFLPKINLVAVGEQTAGLRIDDAILLGLSIVCFWANFSSRKYLTDIEIALFSLVGFSILSCVINHLFYAAGLLSVKASFLYSFRILEYFLFFYIGIFAFRFCRIETIIGAFFLWNLLLMILQKFQIIGIFSVEGYMPADDRMLGIASFGSEIGLLLNLMFSFLMYQNAIVSKRIYLPIELKRVVSTIYPYILLLLFVYLVVLSGARMAIFALFVSFLFYLKDITSWKRPSSYILPLGALTIGILLMIYALYTASDIISRSKGLLSFANLDLISVVWDNIALEYNPIGRESVRMGSYDASWWMRIHKWCYALKLYWLHPESWLQGIGPGFAMAALDGGFLRILTELGIIGCVLYGRLFYLIARQSTQLYWMMVAFMLNMVFFDVYLAYKPMSLLFLIVGYAYASQAAPHEAFPQRHTWKIA